MIEALDMDEKSKWDSGMTTVMYRRYGFIGIERDVYANGINDCSFYTLTPPSFPYRNERIAVATGPSDTNKSRCDGTMDERHHR